MSVTSCFWALLSLDNFEFVYLPDFVTDVEIAFGKTPADILLKRSLLQFIHPEELSLAKTDLMNFVRIKTLAGAVTRCRLKSIKSIIYQEYRDMKYTSNLKEDWIITDVVMYTATNKTILTFFHSHGIIENTSCCGSRQFDVNESNTILNILELYSTLPIIEDEDESPRIFQIYDTSSKQLIISWPNNREELFIKNALKLANIITKKEIEKRIEQHSQLKTIEAACTHHYHSNSTSIIEPYGLCQIERIIITYGCLTFSSFRLTPIVLEDNIRSYHHYKYCASSPIITTKLKRKSNINDILNNTPKIKEQQESAINYHSHTNIVLSSPLLPHPLLPPLTSQISLLQLQQQYNPSSFLLDSNTNDIPKKYTENKLIDITTPVTNNKLPLPRAWRGRFGAYEKKCENCQTNTSPEWRRGPSGHKTLCNACGLRYARLVAKHERQQQGTREEDALILTKSKSAVTKKI